MPHRDVFPRLIAALNSRAARALKVLLETRHLYQKEQIGGGELVESARTRMGSFGAGILEFFEIQLRAAGGGGPRFILSNSGSLSTQDRDGTAHQILTLNIENVKLFCSVCDTREAFTPIWFSDASNEIRKGTQPPRPAPFTFQLFTLVFQCQICKKGFASFLIRQESWMLFLEGRSPFEQVEVPRFIPKQETAFFRDALVAFNAGKTLAALFYLRTFIEQFGRRQTGIHGRETGDAILAAYAETIPLQHRSAMPSLASAYSDLSEALHSAKSDAPLFDKVRSDVEHHFDIRRVYKIPDTSKAPEIPKGSGAE